MGIAKKISAKIRAELQAEHVRLDEEGGEITGFVVSDCFLGKTSPERQRMISSALQKPDSELTPEEIQQVVLIVGVTPAEYDSVGAPIQVHIEDGPAPASFQLLIRGTISDARYIRDALLENDTLIVDEPYQDPGLAGILISLNVRGKTTEGLSRNELQHIMADVSDVSILQST